MTRKKYMDLKVGWGFNIRLPDGQVVEVRFKGWKGRRATMEATLPEGYNAVPVKEEPGPGPNGRPHRWVRNAGVQDEHGDVDGNR